MHSCTFLYANDVRTAQETHPSASKACYRDIYTFLYADDVRTAQETPHVSPRPVTGIFILFFMQVMFVPHRKRTHMSLGLLQGYLYFSLSRSCSYRTGNTHVSPRPVTGIFILFFMQVMFVPHRKHTHVSPRPVTEIFILFFMRMMFVPNRKHNHVSPRLVTGIAHTYHLMNATTNLYEKSQEEELHKI
jgi:hypothetical protein